MALKLSQVKEGDVLIADDGFTCLKDGDRRTVKKDADGLYIECADNKHYLDWQTDFSDPDLLVGLAPA